MIAGLVAMACALPLAGITVSGIGPGLDADSNLAFEVSGSPIRAICGVTVGALGVLWTAAGSAWMGRLAFVTGRTPVKR